MDKALVAQGVANRLFATEKAVDTAMAEAASLMTSLIDARSELQLSAVVGDETTMKVAQAIATLAQARQAIVAAHSDLADLKLRVGIRTKLIGVTDKPVQSFLETDLRRVS
ncbi:MAG: hypothetical protein JWO72_2904 [Caulobacteraceae bacterium]|jgi:hypothetical protein|nr:hypothetical protein [Caulobacteraceae bacterium]